jgi:Zinc finger, C2H2 type
MNGAVDPSQQGGYPGSDGSSYTPIDPALTAPPQRITFNTNQSNQTNSGRPYLSPHIPPSNFNPGRRYSTPALSSTTAPYSVPNRQQMYPPQGYQRNSTEPSLFAAPAAPRSPAFSSPMRSTQFPAGYNLDRRMSMPTNSLWQLAHQSTAVPQQQSPPQGVPVMHTETRPRQQSMVDWRMSGSSMPPRPAQNPLLADLDASAGMLSLRQSQWGGPSQQDPNEEPYPDGFDQRRQSYEAFLPTAYEGVVRRGSIDSNATQPGSVGDGVKKHTCPLCHKKFTRPSSLQTHMYSHTGEKRTPAPLVSGLIVAFKCEVEGCGRSFSVVSNLRRHKKIHSNSGGR